jgi:carbamoylphosphate synthase large subunit
MNNKTRTLIRDIQNKIRNPITKEKEFANEEAVIDYAVKTIYDLMKKQRLL